MKRILLTGLALFAAAAPVAAQRRPAPPPAAAPLTALADAVSEQRLRQDIEKLVSFGTRHTLSEQNHPTRGIGASLRWTADEFRRIGRECGGCITIAEPSEVVTGRRIPQPTKVWNVLGIQRGTTDPNRVIIISGHIDSRVSDVMDATKDAPGANDDGSGVAATLEAARVLSKHRFPTTIVYAVLSGEEQGLYGGKILADYAKAQGGRSGPISTTTSSATAAAPTACATRPTSASSPKARAGRGGRISPPASAASAAKTTRPRATSPASSPSWRPGSASASTSARSGATTASAAAATTPSC
jgi:hypothetical protein